MVGSSTESLTQPLPDPLSHCLTHSLSHSFTHPHTHPLTCCRTRAFTTTRSYQFFSVRFLFGLLTSLPTHRVMQSLTSSPIHPTHPLTRSPTHPLSHTHSLTHSLIHYFPPSFTCLLTHSLTQILSSWIQFVCCRNCGFLANALAPAKALMPCIHGPCCQPSCLEQAHIACVCHFL